MGMDFEFYGFSISSFKHLHQAKILIWPIDTSGEKMTFLVFSANYQMFVC